ncbi:MAG: endonuclease V [Acidobacteriota bacterium]
MRMKACLDVHYWNSSARGACILIQDWKSSAPVAEFLEHFEGIEPYVPGQFYRRESPCLLALLKAAQQRHEGISAVVVDAFVWLGDYTKPGLGGYLFAALGQETPVIGVAKNWRSDAYPSAKVYRGENKRPLFISAAGMNLEEARDAVESMAGVFRMPMILKRVDQLCRGVVEPRLSLG